MVFCPNCGKFVVDNATSCIHCGYNLTYSADQPTPGVQRVEQQVQQPQPQQYISMQVTPISPPFVISQQTILNFVLGIITGILLIVALQVPWTSIKSLYGTAINYDVPDLVKSWGEFGYLYIIAIFGVLILIFTVLLPFIPKIIIGDKTLFPKLILIFSIIALVISGGCMAHVATKFSDKNWSYGVGPFITIIAGVMGIFTGYSAIKSTQPSLQFQYIVCRRCGYQNESWRIQCQRCLSGLG
jgi:hypothetical protein